MRRWLWLLFLFWLLGGCAPAVSKEVASSANEQLFEGIEYRRLVYTTPRPMLFHVIRVDLRTPGLRFLVTPPDDPKGEYPLRARTTSQFLEEFDLLVAINGDGFSPWWSNSLLDYYPHVGDPVRPRGMAASQGKVYARSDAALPTLFISSRNQLSFKAPARPYNAISGERMLVMGGKPVMGLDATALHPRSAVGYNRNGRYLYLIVVDGRQPFYSEGITLAELAEWMVEQGIWYGMNLDGGGSSTLVVRGEDGRPRLLNSPIDQGIPGRERPVANHLGIYRRR